MIYREQTETSALLLSRKIYGNLKISNVTNRKAREPHVSGLF